MTDFSHTARFVAWHARRTPDATAIVEAGVAITYASFAADLVRLVCALRRIPVRAGMLAGVETPDRSLHLRVLLACETIGATTISLTETDFTADNELLRGCDVVLTTNRLASEDGPRTVVMTAAWLAAHSDERAVLDQDLPGGTIVRLARSSGTTANPKTIAISLVRQQLIVARNAEWVARDLTERQSFLCLYHLTIRSVYHRVLGCLQQGGTIWFAVESEALDLIAAGTVNAVMFVTGDAERLAPHARPPPPGHRLLVWAIGGAVGPRLREVIRRRLNATFVSYYSSNETGRVACVDDDNVGVLCPGVAVRIVDGEGRDVAPGETGRIVVRTETMVDGYFNDPDLTARRFAGGWFDTNDVGFMPAPDRLSVLGRADDILNIGGVKISPAPIEAQIRTIDGISDAAVLSIDGGSDLLVAIETPTGDLPPGFAARIDPIMAPYRMTFKLLITKQFPRTGTKKVRRGALVSLYSRTREGTA